MRDERALIERTPPGARRRRSRPCRSAVHGRSGRTEGTGPEVVRHGDRYPDDVRVRFRAAREADLLDDEKPLRPFEAREEPLDVAVRAGDREDHRQRVGPRLVGRRVRDRVGTQAGGPGRRIDLLDQGSEPFFALAEGLGEERGQGLLGLEEPPLGSFGVLGPAAGLVPPLLEAGLLGRNEGPKTVVVERPVGDEDGRVAGEGDEKEDEEDLAVSESRRSGAHGFASRSR